jgi:multiple sugar transport system ATP-binding protein
MTTISLKHIHKSFGAVAVVKDLSLEIADREFLVLLGPSGCGKTTTMRMVAGLEHPTQGEIAFDGARVNELPTRERDVAMVFQNYGLYPHMTVEQNIGYPLKLRGVPPAERAQRVARAAERFELGPYLQRMPRALSGGQRQRVALARSVVRQPRVFLMDEPLSNLDAKLRLVARSQIKHLVQELAVTTLYVTHDQVEAMTLANRVAVMHEGVIRQLDTPENIYDRPADTFVAGFIGSPAMNFIPAKLEQASGALRLHLPQDIVLDVPAARTARYQAHAGRDVLFGIRPEHLTDDKPTDKSNTAPVTLKPEVIEPMGMETLVHFKLNGTEVSARLDPATPAAVGAPLSLIAHMDQMHLIDPTSDKVL